LNKLLQKTRKNYRLTFADNEQVKTSYFILFFCKQRLGNESGLTFKS
jgi:hypothetical protein